MLRPGDTIRVLALSRSLGALRSWYGWTDDDVARAQGRLEDLGLRVTYGAHVEECDDAGLVPLDARLDDFHAAQGDASVQALLAVTGGAGAIQMLDRIEYGASAKPVIGYSDIGYLHLALHARAGLVGFYGPNFSSFAWRDGMDDTLAGFRRCLFAAEPFDVAPSARWSDDGFKTSRPNDGFWPIAPGTAEGVVLGGSALCLNMLKGTRYIADASGAVWFVESPGHGKASLMALDSDLRALGLAFGRPAGVVIGRYPAAARVERDALQRTVTSIPHLAGAPVLANVDFGHTLPMITVPIGGYCRLEVAADKPRLTLYPRSR